MATGLGNRDYENLADLVYIAKRYASLGDAIQRQLDDMLEGDFTDINPNAARYIFDWLAQAEFTDIACDFEIELRKANA
jgi:hypothetical protein